MYEDSEFGTPEWRFGTTPWSDILSARGLSRGERAQRLSFLAERYWRPVYHFVRRKGQLPENARDLTQSFFSMILDTDFVGRADPKRGKFRTYLLTALTRFLTRDFQRETSLPRETLFVARVEDKPETFDETITPQQEFDRQWAQALIGRVVGQLKEFCERKGEQFAFKVFSRRLLEGNKWDYGATRALSLELEVDRRVLESAYRRALKWCRELLHREVRSYVLKDAEIEEEICGLWKVLG